MINKDDFVKTIGPLDEPITNYNLIPLVIYLMKSVNDIRGVKGANKKRLVVYYIEKHCSDMSLNGIIPDIIDSFVGIEKGNIKIKKRSFFSLRIRDRPFRS